MKFISKHSNGANNMQMIIVMMTIDHHDGAKFAANSYPEKKPKPDFSSSSNLKPFYFFHLYNVWT